MKRALVLACLGLACGASVETVTGGTGGISPSTTTSNGGTGGLGGMGPAGTGSGGVGPAGTGSGGTGSGGADGGSGGSGATGGSGQGGASGMFPSILDDGPWLIGWAGGLDHFSWVFFDLGSGTFEVVDASCVSCTPFIQCTGTGSFSTDAEAAAATLALPPPCAQAMTFVFGPFEPAPDFPPSALVHSAIIENPTTQQLDAYLYPDSFCSGTPTICSDPFQ